MTIQEFKDRLRKHDWFYSFSDDGRVFQRGEQEHQKLLMFAKSGGDDFKRAYNVAHAKRWNTKQFAGPYKFPFPEFAPVTMDDPMFQ